MSSVKRFEDLVVWQRGIDLVERVYEITGSGKIARDFALSNQMHGAAISIPSNIAEGFERGTRSEFHRFLSIAKGSCAELRAQMYIAGRVGYWSDETLRDALEQAEHVANMIGKLRMTVARHRDALTKRVPHTAFLIPGR